MTAASVESIISGALTSRTSRSRKPSMSPTSSRSGSCRQTSSTCAPALTCARPTSAAASYCPSAISRLNLRLPRTLVRSPTRSGRLSAVSSTASRPETRARRWRGTAPRRAAVDQPGEGRDVRRRRAAAAADEVEPAGVEEAAEHAREDLRPLGVAPVLVRQAGVGHAGDAGAAELGEGAHVVGHQLRAGGAVEADVEQVGVERARPRAPRRPGRRAWCRSVSMVAETATGRRQPAARRPPRCRAGRP